MNAAWKRIWLYWDNRDKAFGAVRDSETALTFVLNASIHFDVVDLRCTLSVVRFRVYQCLTFSNVSLSLMPSVRKPSCAILPSLVAILYLRIYNVISHLINGWLTRLITLIFKHFSTFFICSEVILHAEIQNTILENKVTLDLCYGDKNVTSFLDACLYIAARIRMINFMCCTF